MTQTLALLLDAYRELNARKMFWISIVISALVMVGFALLGLKDDGLTLLWFKLPVPSPRFFYKMLFSNLVIGLWISMGAMVLALISTASIFPDLLASGSIDLYLAKPISRLRLFLTKFACGMLFVLLQTTVFAVASYFVFGLRGGQWRPMLFLIIPLGTLLFSYLFAVCVLFGVMTRSTVAAILLTCVFWLLCFVTNTAEQALYQFRTVQSTEARGYERQAAQLDDQLVEMKAKPSGWSFFGLREQRMTQQRDDFRRQAAKAEESTRKLTLAHRIVRGFATVIPKTGETVALLDRNLFSDADLASMREEMMPEHRVPPPSPPTPTRKKRSASTSPTTGPAAESELLGEMARKQMEQERAIARESHEAAERASRSRSVPWILGTSIGFEIFALSLAAWIFCRRDY